MTATDMQNPYPGLRPFEPSENYLFFGRDGQSNELLRRLRQNRFLAVVGTSGCGKSSLVRAGLLPDLQSGMMADNSSRWRIALLRPGADPIGHLAAALCRPGILLAETQDIEDSAMETAFMTVTLQRSALGIIEAFHQSELPTRTNLLIVVDQFEELFRFKKAAPLENAADQAAAFVKLLLTAAKQPDEPVYVIITMRSDFLGDCTQFRDLPETINDGQFLVPRMTRGERREAITGPASVGGAAMTPRLVQRLLNDVGDNPDQLPILQHALMRTWSHWQSSRQPDGPIDLPDYEAIGGMQRALSQHADEAYAELAEGQGPDRGKHRQQIAEKLFKFLSEKGADNREIRHPGTLAEIAAAVGAGERELASVIDVFRRPQRSFLMPPSNENLTADTLIDISHESLIRNWQKLRTWVEEEAESATTYRRLVESAMLYRKEQEGLLTDPRLHIDLDWREQQQPNPAWAKRYHPAFVDAMDFLEASEGAYEAEKAAEAERVRLEEAARKRELQQAQQLAAAQTKAARQSRLIAVISIAAFVSALGLLAFGWMRNEEAAALREYDYVREVAALATQENAKDPERGILIASEALKQIVRTEEKNPFPAAVRSFSLWAVSKIYGQPTKVSADQLSDTADALRQAIRDFNQNEHQLKSRTGQIIAAAFSNDGSRIISLDRYGRIQRWNSENFEEAPFEPKNSQHSIGPDIVKAIFSPDAKLVAIANRGYRVQIFAVESLEKILETEADAAITAIAFSPDSQHLAIASSSGSLKLWNSDTKKPVLLENQDFIINALAFSPDNQYLASARKDGKITIWAIDSRKPISDLNPDKGDVHTLIFNLDGSLLACGTEKGIQLYAIDPSEDGKEPTYKLRKSWKSNSPITLLSFDPQSRKLAADDGTKIMYRKILTGFGSVTNSDEKTVPHAARLTALAFSPDGKRLLTAGRERYRINRGLLKLWEVAFPEELPVLLGHSGTVRAVAFHRDGNSLTTASDDGSVRIWSTGASPELDNIRDIRQHELDARLFYTLSQYGSQLASVTKDHTIKVSAVATDTNPVLLELSLKDFSTLALSGDGTQLATAETDGVIKVWDIGTKKTNNETKTHLKKSVRRISFDRSGKRLAIAGSDGTAEIWNINTDEFIWSMPKDQKHEGGISAITFSHDGAQLATTGSWDRVVKVWDTKTGSVVQSLSVKGRILDVAFSPDGKRLATAYNTGKTDLWDIGSGKNIFTLSGHESSVYAVAFSPDGKQLATAGADGIVRLHAADAKELLRLAQKKVDRPLTLKECQALPLVLKNCELILALHGRLENAKNQLENTDTSNLSKAEQEVREVIADANEEKIDFKQLGFKPLSQNEQTSHEIAKIWLMTTLENMAKKQANKGEIKLLNSTLQKLKEQNPSFDSEKIRKIAAQTLEKRGIKLAWEGDVEEAEATFTEALEWDPNRDLNPKKRAKEENAKSLDSEGNRLARAGDFEAAEAAFRKALELDPSLGFKPDEKVRKLRLNNLSYTTAVLLRDKKVEEAFEKYREAERLDPELKIPAENWANLCWVGVLADKASTVLDACEKAVKLAPDNGGYRDSRGVAKAMTGNLEGVIQDFETYVEWAPTAKRKRPQERIDRRKLWVQQLKKGGNPFSEKNRTTLLDELKTGG